ncbi:MAG TPA: hypothetical protein VMU40_02015 [Steroidobacteraceae bacterium]|nr:hypothetical protein [Steroidobacteraceae bacterium]
MSPEFSTATADAAPIDRRTFLGSATAAAFVAATGVCVAAPTRCPTEAGASEADEWHVDDICGHRPRYAHPIPHSPARCSPVLWERVDPIDRMLVI